MLERVDYAGIPGCARLHNGEIEILVADRLGLVIAALRPLKGENLLSESGDGLVRGHRMITWPKPGALYDSTPRARVTIEERAGGWRFTQDDSATLGVRADVEIMLESERIGARFVHRLTNTSLWTISLSLVCLTSCASGGVLVAPLPGRHMRSGDDAPCGQLYLWPETDLSDPRWMFGKELIFLKSSQALKGPQRIGLTNSHAWLGFWRARVLLVVNAPYRAQRPYPRGGASSEIACAHDSLELVTVSPYVSLAPGEALEHVEQWRLYRDVPEPADEEIVQREIMPLLAQM